ncbi:hypothetical protein [Streptomyces tendae]|uniref:hypothetical protein n=1 Tax=Streptomyces tendae TaxID=1932 RepID=UPI001F0E2982|nr:hypothetical protein [Streptomyces tendae]
MLISEFARFLGLPVPQRMNQVQITNAVCELLCERTPTRPGRRRTPDGHPQPSRRRNLRPAQVPRRTDPGDLRLLRHRRRNLPLLTGVRGAQLAGRFKIVRNQPLRYGSSADKQIWHDLVHGMDNALRLRRHRPGTLLTHAAYLHARTSGRMGSLSHLIREAALVSLLDDTEKITKRLLEQIELDTTAEQRTRAPHRRRTPPQHQP